VRTIYRPVDRAQQLATLQRLRGPSAARLRCGERLAERRGEAERLAERRGDRLGDRPAGVRERPAQCSSRVWGCPFESHSTLTVTGRTVVTVDAPLWVSVTLVAFGEFWRWHMLLLSS
jgi:hypothetical protein